MKNKIIRKGLIIVIIILILGAEAIFGYNNELKNNKISNIKVNTLYVGGDGPGNYTKIQDAINDAFEGVRVFVYDDSSPYYENIIINKSIFLTGENKYTTVIDGSGTGDVINVCSGWINIRGFTIRNGESDYPNAGIYVTSNYGMISSNIIENNFFGIFMFSSDKLYIHKNNITNNLHSGVYLEESPNNYISTNFISNHPKNGVALCNSSNDMTVFNNTILNNKYSGILISNSNNNFINYNTISKNIIGAVVEYSTSNEFLKNNFIKNLFIEAYQIGSGFFKNRNIWKGNYWNRPRVLPKPIFGRTGLNFIKIPWFNIDFIPAYKPNEYKSAQIHI